MQMKLHDNPTSPILLPQLRALHHGGGKEKQDPGKITRNTSLDIPCFLGRQTVSLLWEEYVKQISIYNCFLHGWLNWSHFAKLHKKKESSISWILWLVLANSWGERKWLAGGDTLRIYEAAEWNLNGNWNGFLFFMLTLNYLFFFSLRFFA